MLTRNIDTFQIPHLFINAMNIQICQVSLDGLIAPHELCFAFWVLQVRLIYSFTCYLFLALLFRVYLARDNIQHKNMPFTRHKKIDDSVILRHTKIVDFNRDIECFVFILLLLLVYKRIGKVMTTFHNLRFIL